MPIDRPLDARRGPGAAGDPRQGRDVALPGHRGHVLHRPDRDLHRPPGREPVDRLQQSLLPGTSPRDFTANPEAKVYNWPLPYDEATNPLSIDLTAANTFILICSSVTMVLALAAIQRGDRRKLTLYLWPRPLIGSIVPRRSDLRISGLMFGHLYPVGISPTGHFTPDVSLFASCFFTMTGFHGAHVAGGVRDADLPRSSRSGALHRENTRRSSWSASTGTSSTSSGSSCSPSST